MSGISNATGITQTNDLANLSGVLPVNKGGSGSTTGVPLLRLVASGVASANSSLVVPANAFIQQIIVKNNTANAVTGGLKFGTSSGAVDIVAALTVGASALIFAVDSAILKRIFSTSATQQVFIDAVVAWNNANVDITIVYGQL